MNLFILGVLLGLAITLPMAHRLICQRDRAERGRLMLLSSSADERATFKRRQQAFAMREAMLLSDLDFAVNEAVNLREHIRQLEAEALPKAPNWGAAPAEWQRSDEAARIGDGVRVS